MSLSDAWSKDHQDMVDAAVAAERERCAKIVDSFYRRCIDPEVSGSLFEMLRQIRGEE